jgi:CheY-like chemotaxis protein
MPLRMLLVGVERHLNHALIYFGAKDGYEVDSVPSGTEALLALQQKEYNILICESLMLPFDGFELEQKIRTELALTDLPVIVLSENTLNDNTVADTLSLPGWRGTRLWFISRHCYPMELRLGVPRLLARLSSEETL